MKKARVLVIDDEPSVADALKTILRDSSYDAVTAATGREGIELVRRQRFDLAIIDLKLPDISGFAALTEISGGLSCPVAVLITACDAREIRDAATAAGFAAVLAKPFSPSILLDVLQAALFEARGRKPA
jgi:DNA-binding response OmpR family regulator